jgi:hypothetical protein
MRKPGKIHSPTLNAARNLAKESSEDNEVSNIQMMNGISRNMRTPLTRCRMETHPAAGSR